MCSTMERRQVAIAVMRGRWYWDKGCWEKRRAMKRERIPSCMQCIQIQSNRDFQEDRNESDNNIHELITMRLAYHIDTVLQSNKSSECIA